MNLNGFLIILIRCLKHWIFSFWGESLKCRTGDEVTFGCPCCPEKLDSFTFEKIEGDFIARNGALNNLHNKYELSENKTQVTLKMCNEDDKGSYIWKCDNHEHFVDLTIIKEDAGNKYKTDYLLLKHLQKYINICLELYLLELYKK